MIPSEEVVLGIGGIAMLLLLTMLAVMRLSIGWRAMAPGFAVAAMRLLEKLHRAQNGSQMVP